MAEQKINLDYIAGKCGVSRMTVSRALRNDSGVSPATREAVLRAAGEVNYFPRARQTGLEARPRRYYILCRGAYAEQGSFFGELILNIQRELFVEGSLCSFATIPEEYPEFIRLYSLMQSEQVDGVFVVGDAPVEYLKELLKSFEHTVFVDYPGDASLGPYNAVVFDNQAGCYLAVRHLLSLGRRRILLAAGPEEHYFTKAMVAGYAGALLDSGLPVSPELIVYADFLMSAGQGVVERALADGLDFDAVFGTDLTACGALAALSSAGRRVPQEVSVVGFDGLPIGEAVTPALTTVVADRGRMGRLAVQRLRELENGPGAEGRFVKESLFPELLVRQSCGAG